MSYTYILNVSNILCLYEFPFCLFGVSVSINTLMLILDLGKKEYN